MIERSARWIKRLAIALVGVAVLVTGIVLLVLPGPAVVVIPLGLGILSLEFAWARYLLRRLQEGVGLGNAGSGAERPGGYDSDPVDTGKKVRGKRDPGRTSIIR